MTQQERISQTFIALADTLVAGYDPIDFLQQLAERCVELLGVTDAGIVLVGPDGLRVLASSSDRMRLLELLEVQRNDGPCLEAWATGSLVRADRLTEAVERWPRFTPAALDAGYQSAYAHPMRLRATSIGALNLFADVEDGLDENGQALGQALADMATIGMVHERMLREQEILSDQLQHALTSRVTIEQAKGVIAEQGGLEMADAFQAMRVYARNTNRLLTDVARDVVGPQADSQHPYRRRRGAAVMRLG